MEQIRTKGLILKVLNLNDNDRIFTILTRDSGKLTVMAKGIRSQKNKYFGAMQLFCYTDFVLEKKTGMYYPVGAELIENFFEIRNSVEKVAVATYICDIANSIPDEFPLDDDYFSFILNTLYVVSKQNANSVDFKYDLLKYKFIFEMKTVCENGYEPSIMSCMSCGGSKDISYFDVASGRVVCQKCFDKTFNTELCKISSECYKVLYVVINSDLRSVLSLKLSNGAAVELNALSEKYMEYQMEILPTSNDYLKNILQINQ